MKHSKILYSALVATASLLAPVTASALNSMYYSSESILNSGRWVKIKVTGNGIHQITYDQLRQWGFNNPEAVNVYGYSVALLSDHSTSTSHPDDLPLTAVYRGENRLLFYGEADVSINVDQGQTLAVKRNLSDLAGYYFLSDIEEPITPQTLNLQAAAENSETTHVNFVYIEPEEYNPISMGANFYSREIDTEGRVFELPFANWAQDTEARIFYNYVGRTEGSITPAIALGDGVKIYYHTAGTLTDNSVLSPYNEFNRSSQGNIRVNLVDSTTTVIPFKFAKPAQSTVSFVSLDNVSLVYTRRNSLKGLSELRMNFPSNAYRQPVNITDATPNTLVWDITNRNNIGSYITNFNPETSTLNFVLGDNASPAVVAFDVNGTFPGVEFAGNVDNQNLHGRQTPDMVIVAVADLLPQAERLAGYHRDAQGLDILVVDQQKIFNEFSSGARSVDGYRRMMKMFYDRDGNKLKYILLMGEASFDNRGIISDADANLLTFPAEIFDHACNVSVCYAADSFFGMLEDGMSATNITTRRLNVAVGRIPSNDVNVLDRYITKVGEYLMNPPFNGSYNQALLLSGDGDANSHLLQADSLSRIINQADPVINVTKGYTALYKKSNGVALSLRQAYGEAFARGQGFFSYTGHGGANILGTIMTNNDITGITFGAAPITFLATCETYQFDNLSSYIAKDLLFTPAGPPAIVAAGRKVYQINNQVFSEAFARNYFSGYEGDCVGDAYVRTHNQTNSDSENQRKNNLCYGLAGDPALPIYRPVDRVKVTAINDIETAGDTVAVYPVDPFKMAGVVTTPDGDVDTDFNGEVFITLYDSPTTVTSLTTSNTDITPVDIEIDEKILGLYVASVKDGRWETTVVSPEPMDFGSNNKITLYARSTNNVTASGIERAIVKVVNGTGDSGFEDTTAPVIEEMYLNTRAFVDGSVVGPASTLVARIGADDSGINFSSSIIGGSTRLILDGNRSYADVKGAMLYNADGSITLTYNFSNIVEGDHVLELFVADNAGNHTSRRLAFRVINNADVALVTDCHTARANVELSLEHKLDVEDFTGRIFVENAAGETIYTSKADVTFPYTWDLKDNNGRRIDDGIYRVFATLRAGGLTTSTPRTPITVIAPR